MNLFSVQSAEFTGRHIGPNENDTKEMLNTIGIGSMEELIGRTVPSAIRMDHELALPGAMSEAAYLTMVKAISEKN